MCSAILLQHLVEFIATAVTKSRRHILTSAVYSMLPIIQCSAKYCIYLKYDILDAIVLALLLALCNFAP